MGEPCLTIDYAKPALTINCAEESAGIIDCGEDRAVTIICAEPAPTIDCAEEPTPAVDSTGEFADIIDCAELFLTVDCTVETCADNTSFTIDCAEEQGLTVAINSAEEQAVAISCAEQPTVIIDCIEPALITDCVEEPAGAINGTKEQALATVTSNDSALTIECTDEPAPTISCGKEQDLTADCAEELATPAQDCARQKPALAIDCAEQQRLEFPGRRKLQLEHFRQDETQSQRNTTDHTVLGFPNIGNTCYMNATLQSLFSLRIFTQDIRREEGCWRSHLTTHLLKCLADLQSAQASYSRKHKIRDAHEFLSVLLSQLKEEGVSLRTRVGLHPYTGSIEANCEFGLLSIRKCLSCGEKVCRTESYNCLSVDLVPGGSVQDNFCPLLQGL
ncbi:hypothetical protein ANANG_G00252690 [Anguilla anguilla]|uniref:USP domain-containing protein n=1 Tax=Anguilla anguilla TaxID=7936 RepID=A0A9D3LV31_ANGAN|nr:hypothetical protein ANANG_G00252690 [Anguilla anguilla]